MARFHASSWSSFWPSASVAKASPSVSVQQRRPAVAVAYAGKVMGPNSLKDAWDRDLGQRLQIVARGLWALGYLLTQWPQAE
jgi:hypothetical protein